MIKDVIIHGKDLRNLPIEERKAKLEGALENSRQASFGIRSRSQKTLKSLWTGLRNWALKA